MQGLVAANTEVPGLYNPNLYQAGLHLSNAMIVYLDLLEFIRCI